MNMLEAPREDLIRMTAGIRADENDDGIRVLTGTPIVFNVWTEINGWEGHFKERIDPGALDKTLDERGDRVKVLFNHGYDPQIGEKPLGKPTMQEPRKDALHVEMPFADTSYNHDIIALLDAEALDGMSFRFAVIADEWEKLDSDMPERTVTELRLYEWGPVTFPAYEATTVGVRSAQELDEYRKRQTALISHTPSKPGLAPDGRTAESAPTQRQTDTKKSIARLVREIDLRTKGITK